MYVTYFYESTKNHDVIISAKTGDFIIMSTLFLRPLVKVILNGKPITDVLKKRQPFFQNMILISVFLAYDYPTYDLYNNRDELQTYYEKYFLNKLLDYQRWKINKENFFLDIAPFYR